MKPEQITIHYLKYEKIENLNSRQIQVLNAAQEIANYAYAPFSLFKVGAALLLEDQSIITGCNQENASFPCGICAERVALYTYGSSKSKVPIKKIAISAKALNTEPVAPCGLCRQVLSEFEEINNAPIEIILGHSDSTIYVFPSANSLLPFHFQAGLLKTNL